MCIEFRKFCTQMTDEEIRTLQNKIINTRFTLTEHAKDRLIQKHISKSDLFHTFMGFEVIEYHYKDGNRVLIREIDKNEDIYNTYNQKKKYNCCVVLNLDNNTIITAYKNCSNDNHITLDYDNYNSSVNILQYIM